MRTFYESLFNDNTRKCLKCKVKRSSFPLGLFLWGDMKIIDLSDVKINDTLYSSVFGPVKVQSILRYDKDIHKDEVQDMEGITTSVGICKFNGFEFWGGGQYRVPVIFHSFSEYRDFIKSLKFRDDV